jgi:hypothetical protein
VGERKNRNKIGYGQRGIFFRLIKLASHWDIGLRNLLAPNIFCNEVFRIKDKIGFTTGFGFSRVGFGFGISPIGFRVWFLAFGSDSTIGSQSLDLRLVSGFGFRIWIQDLDSGFGFICFSGLD